MRRLLIIIALLFAGIVHAGHDGNRNTSTTVQCLPNPAAANSTLTCTATVQDLYGVPGQSKSPTGTVNFSVIAGPGNFAPASCTLVTGASPFSSCSVSYTPTSGGTHIVAAAYSGNTGVGFVGNWLASNGSTSVTVNNPTPSINAVSPVFGLRGDTLNVTITGGDFASVGITATFGAGITVNSLTWVDSGTLTANISIASAAATGLRNVTVTNPAPVGGSATLVNGFEVRNPAPVIGSLTPAATEAGSGALVVTIDGSGFVPDSVASYNGGARSTVFVNSTQLQMSLAAPDTDVVGSYPVQVVNPAPGGGTSNTVQFSVVVSGGSFDTVESGTAPGGAMFTKLAGTTFAFDVLATDVSRLSINASFTGTVNIELLDAADDSGALDTNGCRASWTTLQTLPNATFAAGDTGRISASVNSAAAVRVARFRISYPATGVPSHVGCSADAFSIRPTSLDLSTSLNNGSTSGTPVHAAGSAFTMTATAIPGYDGVPQVNAVAGVTGTLAGSFSAANPATGESTGNGFIYDEVGSFLLAATELYDDSFTAVDQPDDCATGFLDSLGRYGCSFGNIADTDPVGRFVPAYFDVEVAHGCADAGGFTYSGQPFLVTVTARESGGGVTQNYAGAYAKETVLSDAGDTSRFTASNIILAMDFMAGIASDIDVIYTVPVPATPFTTINLRAVDEDLVSSSGHLEESTEIRSGRLVLGNVSAITSNDGLLPVILQAWQETSATVFEWDVHAEDTTCTTLNSGNFTLSNAQGPLAGNTAISGFFFNAGQGMLTLSAPGPGNYGSVDADVATGSWLHFDWNSTGTPESPVGKITFFEIFETEQGFIDRYEIIPQ